MYLSDSIMMNVDSTSITGYWNWVRNMEFLNVKVTVLLLGESSVYPSAILKDPDKYFTGEVMEKLDWAAGQEFKYGS